MNLVMGSVLLAMVGSINAFAGAESHGGQSVVCEDAQGKITSIEFLDHYEGENTMPFKLDMGPQTNSYLDTVNYVLDRLAKFDPVAAQRYKKRAQAFETNTLFNPKPLTPIDDANEPIAAEKGCMITQFGEQNYPLKPYQKRYLVNKTLWDQANAQARAGLVLHEVIYTDALVKGQTNSDKTRYFNYFISSEKMNALTGQEYMDLIKYVNFWGQNGSCDFSISKYQIAICLNDIFFVKPEVVDGKTVGQETYGHTPVGMTYSFPGNPAFSIGNSADCHDFSDGKSINGCDVYSTARESLLAFGIEITLDAASRIYTMSTEVNPILNGPSGSPVISKDTVVKIGKSQVALSSGTQIDFYNSGAVKNFATSAAQPFAVSLPNGSSLSVDSAQGVSFFEDGSFEMGTLLQDTNLSVGSHTIKIAKGSVIFSEQGSLARAMLSSNTDFVVQNQTVQVASKLHDGTQALTYFYDDGSLKTASFLGDVVLNQDGGGKCHVKTRKDNACFASFTQSGALTSAVYYQDSTNQTGERTCCE